MYPLHTIIVLIMEGIEIVIWSIVFILSMYLLRSHHPSWLGYGLIISRYPCNPKVGDFRVHFFIKKNVACFEIPMNNFESGILIKIRKPTSNSCNNTEVCSPSEGYSFFFVWYNFHIRGVKLSIKSVLRINQICIKLYITIESQLNLSSNDPCK